MVGLRVLSIRPLERTCHKHTDKVTTRGVGMLEYKSGGWKWCVISGGIFMFVWGAEMLALNVPTAPSWQNGNAFASRQMTTENFRMRNSSLIRHNWRQKSLSTLHIRRCIKCFSYVLEVATNWASDYVGRVWNGVLVVRLQVPCHHIPRTEGNYDSVRITDLRGKTRSSDFPFTKQESL